MDPTLRTMTNWIVNHLAEGFSYNQTYRDFVSHFGATVQADFLTAYYAARDAIANAEAFGALGLDAILGDVLTLPGDAFSVVEIRALLTFTQTVDGQTVEQFRTFSANFGYDNTVGDVYAFYAELCRDYAIRYEMRCSNITIIPGLYFPG